MYYYYYIIIIMISLRLTTKTLLNISNTDVSTLRTISSQCKSNSILHTTQITHINIQCQHFTFSNNQLNTGMHPRWTVSPTELLEQIHRFIPIFEIIAREHTYSQFHGYSQCQRSGGQRSYACKFYTISHFNYLFV